MNTSATLYVGLDGAVIPTAPSSDAGWGGVDNFDLICVENTALVAPRELVFRLNMLAVEPGIRLVYVASDAYWARDIVDGLGLRRRSVAVSAESNYAFARIAVDRKNTILIADPAIGLTRDDMDEIERTLGVREEVR